MWHDFFSKAVRTRPNEPFPKPEPQGTTIPILRGEIDKENPHNILFYLNRLDDPQYFNWETGVQEWLRTHILPEISIPTYSYAEGEETPDSVRSGLKIEFLNPKNGDFITGDTLFQSKITSIEDIVRIETYVNDRLIDIIAANSGKNINYQKIIPFYEFKNQNRVVIKIIDSLGNSGKELIVYR